jgi:DNA-binding NtrC family response regulator
MEEQAPNGRAATAFLDSVAGIQCVFLSCFDHEVAFLAAMLGRNKIRFYRADTLEEADLLLVASEATVLLADSTFLDGTGMDALEMLRTVHPLTAAIICEDPVDGGLADGAGYPGAFDVCRKPLDHQRLRLRIEAADEATRERRLWFAARGAATEAAEPVISR